MTDLYTESYGSKRQPFFVAGNVMHAEPYDRPRDFFARQVGLGRAVVWSTSAAAVLSTLGALAAGSWAVYETRLSTDRVERYVVYLDDQSLPVGQAQIGKMWTPTDGAYLDFASRWIRFLRARPLDVETLKFQRREVIYTTDARVYSALKESMQAADDQLRQAAVDVLSVSANLVESGPSRTVVLVRWTERVRDGGLTKATPWTGTLTLAYEEPKVHREFERNPLGIYVVDFQLSQESK
jgi:type IV secretory pathway TrbF-like protein